MTRKRKKQEAPVAAVIADPHVGNRAAHGGAFVAGINERGGMSVDVLRRAVKLARDEDAGALFVAGDLFHSSYPKPAEIAAVQRMFDVDMPIVVVPGNHDMIDATAEDGNTACEPLTPVATVVRAPDVVEVRGRRVLCVPFQAVRPMRDHLADYLASGAPEYDDLVTHVGCYDQASPDWMWDAMDGMSAEALARSVGKGRRAFVGNYHRPQSWTFRDAGEVHQVGTLCPGGWRDDGMDYGRVYLLYPDGSVGFRVVGGPRFLKTEDGVVDAVGDGYWLFGRMESDDGDAQVVRNQSPWHVLEVVPRSKPLMEATARKAEQPEDPRQAIAEYVRKMELPEGIDRKTVRERVDNIWRQA